MKKIFLALLLIISPFSVFAFSDTNNSDFEQYINNMVAENLISWYSDGKFHPNKAVSFVESLKIAINASENFSQIQQNSENWSLPYIDFYNQNFSQNEKTFSQNEKISRDFAIYLTLKNLGVNLEHKNTADLKNFPDVKNNSIFAKYIAFAKATGISSGYDNGNFRPNNNISRGEFTKIIWKTLRENKEEILQKYNNLPIIEEGSINTGVTVVSVSDGDTITVNDNEQIHKLRILGLDTPESFDTRFGYVECYGKEASDYVKNYLPIGTTVDVTYNGNDKYNRDLASISIGWVDLAKHLIENWYGWVYRNGTKPNNYEELLQAEEFAKNNNRWLWYFCNGERKPVQNYTNTTPIATKPNNTPTKSKQQNTNSNYSKPSSGRTYYTWPRGGCFYYSDSGKKVYVSKSYCR